MTNKVVQFAIDNEKKLLRFLMQINGKNLQTAKEVFQETVVRLITQNPQDVEEIKAYVYMAARNTALNYYRNTKRLKLKNSEDEDYYGICDPVDFEALQIDRDLYKKVMSFAHKNLPPGQLKALTDTLSNDKVCISVDGVGFEGIKTARRNAIMKIRQYMLENP